MEAKYYIFAKGYEGMWQAFVKLSLAELFLIISKEMRHASKNAKNNHEKKRNNHESVSSKIQFQYCLDS